MAHRRKCMTLLAGVVLAVSWLAAGGCEPSLFPEGTARTQYERFDRLRGIYRPAEQEGRRGESEKALRRRLAPYE